MYDILIVGGGLAGLINAVQLAKAGLKVGVVEKNTYPFHKVCGEYISNEALPFLESMEISPFEAGAVRLNRFRLTSPKGNTLELPLDLGGFGLSRYTLDHLLYKKAREEGAKFLVNTQISEIQTGEKKSLLKTSKGEELEAKWVIGAYGKRSNLDRQLDRKFFYQRSPYIGVKYHLTLQNTKFTHPDDLIALHNFQEGYCGISRIEEGKYCLCYLTTRKNLKKYHTITAMEENLLAQNKYLEDIFSHATFLYEKPKVINEISFRPKPLIEQSVLMCGDTAGMITPLCGNGMAIAIHSAKVLSELLIQHFEGQQTREEVYTLYEKQWKQLFAKRLWVGRHIQQLFGHPLLTEVLLQITKRSTLLAGFLMKNTHGKIF